MSSPSTDPQAGTGRIVVGIDGSVSSEEALRWAIGQARLTGQQVEAVTSWRIPVDYGMGGAGVLPAFDWEGVAATTLKETVGHVPDSEQVKQRVVMGHPAQVLLDAAEDADLLVVGSRGRGGFKGMLLGSVSQHVVARAACPVVVVRASATESE